MLPWILCGILLLIIAALAAKIMLLQKSMDELCAKFQEHLSTDTNTLISLSSHDIHARRMAQAVNKQLRLLRQQRRRYVSGDLELKEAVTNISHDLRTPLTAIIGYLDMLEKEGKSEAAARYLSVIADRAEALKLLTEELFRYSVVLSTPDHIALEPLSLKALLEESLAAFYPALTGRHITPAIQMPEGPVVVLLDKAATTRVFSNILSNALKYSDGDLSVQLMESGEIIFSNRAAKLDEIQVGKLFNRFFTVEAARNASGLGLAISKTLVEQMGGSITAQYADARLSIRVTLPVVHS